MKRQVLPFALGLALTAAMAIIQTAASGEPGPGLEVFDGGIDSVPGPGVQYMDPQPGAAPYVAPAPAPYPVAQPGYIQGDAQTYIPEPYPVAGGGDPYYAPQPGDPFAPAGGDPALDGPPPDQPAEPAYAPDPYSETLARLNTQNPNYPGLDAAAAQNDLRGAAAIIWDVLKNRRIVQATLERGPGASAGVSSSFEFQAVFAAINYSPATDPLGADTPLRASQRVNVILDAFEMPLVEDFGFGGSMEQALMRLNADIFALRDGMADVTDENVFQELSRTYIRAVVNCDFFLFPRADIVADVRAIMQRAASLFYPDGASVGGDVAGVTGNLFQELLMLDFYSRDDRRFRREVGTMWSTLEKPSQHLVDVALPDLSLPRFGPRGSRELTPMDVARLAEMFPRRSTLGVRRIGLAASDSFPNVSGQDSYGGIFAMRGGTGPGARYLGVRFGPLGNLCDVPPHYDFGSLVLMSRNIKFLVDPGGYGGDASAAWTHSALSLDNDNVLGAGYNEPGRPVDTIWRTNASLDYATDMASFADGKTWQRTVLYVKNLPGEEKNDYWTVLDHVDMKNDNQPRQARIRYQLAPGIQAYHDGSGVLASPGYVDGSGLRFFAVDANAEMTVSEGSMGLFPSHVYDTAGGSYAAPSVTVSRTLVGNSTTSTILYPAENMNHRPARIERDADIIRGRTGALIIDHGFGRIDVVAWAPPGAELVTPTLNLQMAADMAVFRIRDGKFVRINFINLERFQAKEPNGGLWTMRVNGPAQTLTLEPERDGGWQVLSDPANAGSATLYDINLGPAIAGRRFGIRPGDMKVVVR